MSYLVVLVISLVHLELVLSFVFGTCDNNKLVSLSWMFVSSVRVWPPASQCSALQTLGLWWIMLKGNMQEEGKHFYTNARKYTLALTRACTYTPYKHTQTPPRGGAWLGGYQRGPKECWGQKVKGQTNPGGQILREGQHLHTWLWGVCVCVCVWERESASVCKCVCLYSHLLC